MKKQLKPDVSIIILTYNASKLLQDCLTSIKKQTGIKNQTIVVDNLSKDDTLSVLKNKYRWVEVVERNTSVGFSAGNNAGIKIAKADTILFLNPDTKFLNNNDLKKCFDKLQNTKNIGVLSPKIILALSNKVDETCHRGFPTPWAAFTHFSKLEKLFPNSPLFSRYLQTYKGYDSEHEVDSVGGMFMMMPRLVGDKIGWWDEEYPLYGEDIDFCYRVKKLGYKILYWPSVTVNHYKGASTGMSKQSKKVSTASKETTKRVKSWSIIAMETFYRKHYLDVYPAPLTWLVFLGIKLLKIVRVNFS